MKNKRVVTVESDQPVVILDQEEYEALQETVAWLSSSPSLVDEVQEEIKKIEQGKGITFQQLRKELER